MYNSMHLSTSDLNAYWYSGVVQSCIQDFCQGGANLEYVKKRGGEAVRSCRAAAGGWVYLEIQGGARITQGGANAPPAPLNTPLVVQTLL